VEGRLHAKYQLDSSSGFDTRLACGGQTDGRTHDDSKYRASIASRGKNYRRVKMWVRFDQWCVKVHGDLNRTARFRFDAAIVYCIRRRGAAN